MRYASDIAMLKIVKTSSDGVTGHISIDVHVVETVDNVTIEGAKETHGIAPEALQTKYNGNTREWLRDIHSKMLKSHENRKAAAIAVASLQGKTLFNEEDEDSNGNQSQPARS